MSGSAHAMPVTLGLLRLAALEVPVSYSRGATMQPLVHRLIGGGRVVQLMGEDPQVRELEGCFVGPNAVDRALTLEAMRDAGLPVMLTIGAWSELVIITVVTLIYTSRGAVIAYRLRAEAVASQIGLIVQTVSSIAQAALLDLGQAAASTGVGVGLAVPATASMGQAASALGVGAGGLQASYAAGAPALDVGNAGSSLASAITNSGQSLTSGGGAGGDLVASGPAMLAASANAQVLAAATQAGGYVNRAAASVGALNGTQVAPAIHS